MFECALCSCTLRRLYGLLSERSIHMTAAVCGDGAAVKHSLSATAINCCLACCCCLLLPPAAGNPGAATRAGQHRGLAWQQQGLHIHSSSSNSAWHRLLSWSSRARMTGQRHLRGSSFCGASKLVQPLQHRRWKRYSPVSKCSSAHGGTLASVSVAK